MVKHSLPKDRVLEAGPVCAWYFTCWHFQAAKVKAVKQHQTATAAALDALLPSILDRAFKGEL